MKFNTLLHFMLSICLLSLQSALAMHGEGSGVGRENGENELDLTLLGRQASNGSHSSCNNSTPDGSPDKPQAGAAAPAQVNRARRGALVLGVYNVNQHNVDEQDAEQEIVPAHEFGLIQRFLAQLHEGLMVQFQREDDINRHFRLRFMLTVTNLFPRAHGQDFDEMRRITQVNTDGLNAAATALLALQGRDAMLTCFRNMAFFQNSLYVQRPVRIHELTQSIRQAHFFIELLRELGVCQE